MPRDAAQAPGAPRRVLLVSNFYPPFVVGGAELVVAHLAEALARMGHDVSVVTTCGRDEPVRELVRNGVKVHRFFPENLWWNYDRFRAGDTRSQVAKLVWNVRDLYNRSAYAQLAALIRRIRPDIVHTHNLKGISTAAWDAARDGGVPVVHTIHDYYLLCHKGTMVSGGGTCAAPCGTCSVYGRWMSRQARSLQALCSPSAHVLEKHVARGLPGAGRTHVVPNGVPGDAVAAPRARRPGCTRILFMGQLRSEKGVDLLLQAIPSLGPDITLRIAGKGELEADVRRAAATHANVEYLGFIGGEAKRAALDEADALVFPSVWAENAPLTIAEALMAGVPVIASAVGGVGEFVKDRVNGLLIRPGDARALGAAITSLARDAALFRTVQAGAEASGRSYTVEAMARAYLRIYDNGASGAATGFAYEAAG